jgi:hypothetical protein
MNVLAIVGGLEVKVNAMKMSGMTVRSVLAARGQPDNFLRIDLVKLPVVAEMGQIAAKLVL